MSATKSRNSRDRHLAVARRAFGQIADAGLGRDGRSLDVVAADADLAGGGRDEARDHAHGGGFAGAVRAEEAEHLAGRHRERQVVHRQDLAIALG